MPKEALSIRVVWWDTFAPRRNYLPRGFSLPLPPYSHSFFVRRYRDKTGPTMQTRYSQPILNSHNDRKQLASSGIVCPQHCTFLVLARARIIQFVQYVNIQISYIWFEILCKIASFGQDLGWKDLDGKVFHPHPSVTSAQFALLVSRRRVHEDALDPICTACVYKQAIKIRQKYSPFAQTARHVFARLLNVFILRFEYDRGGRI